MKNTRLERLANVDREAWVNNPKFIPLHGCGEKGFFDGIEETGDDDQDLAPCSCGRTWSVELIDAKNKVDNHNVGYYVECSKCEIEGPWGRTTQQAIENWNKERKHD